MCQLHDITIAFLNPMLDWDLTGNPFRTQFPNEVSSIRQGLYASIYENPTPYPIYDRNGPGKIIVKANSATLKYGKFENGIAERHKQNHVHMHRRDRRGTEVEAGICRGCLRSFFVLDLSGCDSKAPRRFETTHWNQPLRAYLAAHNYADHSQPGRSESRYLARVPSTAELKKLLSDLSNRICAAAGKR
jgi:hypothetical protein